MSFTTPCFMRKNTPELRNKLKELGYVQVKQDTYCYHVMVENGNTWVCDGAFNPGNPDGKGWDECIDREYDEDLFIALAALRDDTGHDQWFTNGKEWITYMDNTGKGGLSCFQYFAMPGDMNLENFHEATPTGTIARFKQEE